MASPATIWPRRHHTRPSFGGFLTAARVGKTTRKHRKVAETNPLRMIFGNSSVVKKSLKQPWAKMRCS